MQNEIYKGRSVQTSDREHMSFDQASSHRQYQQTPTSHSWYVWAKGFPSAKGEDFNIQVIDNSIIGTQQFNWAQTFFFWTKKFSEEM